MPTKTMPAYIPPGKVLAYRKGKYEVISREKANKLIGKDPKTVTFTQIPPE